MKTQFILMKKKVLITAPKALLPDVGINFDLIGVSGRFKKLPGKYTDMK